MVDFTFLQAPGQKLTQPLMYPTHLGILYLAAVMEQAGAQVAVADLRDKAPEDVDIGTIPPARYFGITATTPEYPVAKILARALKERYPQSQTIIGGSHATALPQVCCQDGWDVVAVGEWDHAILQLFRSGHPGGIVYGGPAPNLDALPFPARHLVGDRAWSSTLMPGEFHGTGERAAMLISSRGCPYGCFFCASARTLPVRFRSPENVATEVEELVDKYGIRAFRDESDNLMSRREWFLRLCRLLKPLGVHWKGHSRSVHVTDELLEAAREAGMEEMGVGVESCDPTVLVRVGKGETVEDHRRAVELLKKHRIVSKVYLMSGLPGESEESLMMTATFFTEVKPDKWTLSKFTPLPGAEIYHHPERFGATIQLNSESGWFFSGPFTVSYDGTLRGVLEDRHQRLIAYLKEGGWRR